MFVERRLNPATHVVELWTCDWENVAGQAARKQYVAKIGDEQPLTADGEAMAEAAAICWSYGRTLGNIAVYNQSLLGSFPDKVGNDAILPCDFVNAGKFRHGANRWWCRTHQAHWGTVADLEAYAAAGVMTCGAHGQAMNYVVSPFVLDLEAYAEVGIWCSMPAAVSTWEIRPRPPRIHVHVRAEAGGKKEIDRDFSAIALDYRPALGMFTAAEITRVNVTPPAAFEFVCALESGREMGCINCSSCGYPHLDLGDFARKPHRKHFCANCGRDSTWSKIEMVSTPLKPLHDAFTNDAGFAVSERSINIDAHPGATYSLWASTPAILWTAPRPQEVGIHVHLYAGEERIVDDTYGEVVLNDKKLVREDLLAMMTERTIT